MKKQFEIKIKKESDNYRLLDLHTNQITITRKVIFNETLCDSTNESDERKISKIRIDEINDHDPKNQ